MRLAGKTALIAAAGGEWGRAIALGYAREGANLYLQDLPENQMPLERVAEETRTAGSRVVTRACDLSVGSEVAAMTQDVIAQFGRVDVLVNCAFESVHDPFFEISEAVLDRAMDVGPKSCFLTCQYIGKEMARRGTGRIINLTSIVGEFGFAGAVANSAGRGAVNAMTRSIAHALGPYGIRVNALSRGPASVREHPTKETDERLRRLPFGRLGIPEDVVGPAIFLATEESDWVTGIVLYADGGYTSNGVTEDRYLPREVPYRRD